MSDRPASSFYRAYVLFILVVVYTFNFIDRQIVGILAVPIKADLELSDTQLSLMGGLAFALFYTFLGIPIAMLADRYSRTWIMTAALSIWSAMTVACGFTHNFLQLFLARLGVGVGEAGGVAPAYSLISDYFPPEKACARPFDLFLWHPDWFSARNSTRRRPYNISRLAICLCNCRVSWPCDCADIPFDHARTKTRRLRWPGRRHKAGKSLRSCSDTHSKAELLGGSHSAPPVPP